MTSTSEKWTFIGPGVYDVDREDSVREGGVFHGQHWLKLKMPRLYRAMLAEGERPQVGGFALALGVRVPPDDHADIGVAENGTVAPGMGGMSVAPAWRLLPIHRIPRRLRAKVPQAAGKNSVFLWRMGDGTFVEGPLAERLRFRPDPAKPDRHGFVEPETRMPAADYQKALAATRDRWIIDEE